MTRQPSFGGVAKQAHAVHKTRAQWQLAAGLDGTRRYPLPTPAPPLLPSELVTAPDATCYERTRDAVLRGLQHKLFTWLAVIWLVALCADFLFYACTLLGLHESTAPHVRRAWLELAHGRADDDICK